VPPVLCFNENVKDFGEVPQGTNPNPNTFTFSVENCGKGTLTGNVTDNADWLSISPSSFSLGADQSKTITVSATTTNLSGGDYTGKIIPETLPLHQMEVEHRGKQLK